MGFLSDLLNALFGSQPSQAAACRSEMQNQDDILDRKLAEFGAKWKAMGDADRQRIETTKRQSEEKWKEIAARINCTASDAQIYWLLDLGATPEQLEGINKLDASYLIDQLLRKPSGSNNP